MSKRNNNLNLEKSEDKLMAIENKIKDFQWALV